MGSTTGARRTRALLRITFAVIAAVLVVGECLTFVQWRTVVSSVDVLELNVVTSVRLLGRMVFDIERERVLIDRHVFEHEVARMTPIEAQIAAVKADYAKAAKQYALLATFDQEASRWLQLTKDVATAEQATTEALAASRLNRDLEARQIMLGAEPTFDAIAEDTTVLLNINQAAGERARARVAELDANVLDIGILLAAVILATILLLGWRVTRVISSTEEALRRQALELESRNRELDAFAGRVAHDLRGPLSTISLATSILAESLPRESTSKIVQRGIAQMTSLVEDLLGLSRIGVSAGDVTSIATVAEAVDTDLRAMVTVADGTLRVDVEPASVRGRYGLLRQALWNLGENAVKYRRSNVPPEIAIVGRQAGQGYVLEVSDNGLGMSPDEAHHAFDPFFRGERTKTIVGTGLGLAIVRRVIEASGGTVSVQSRRGGGTTFSIRLPLAELGGEND